MVFSARSVGSCLRNFGGKELRGGKAKGRENGRQDTIPFRFYKIVDFYVGTVRFLWIAPQVDTPTTPTAGIFLVERNQVSYAPSVANNESV